MDQSDSESQMSFPCWVKLVVGPRHLDDLLDILQGEESPDKVLDWLCGPSRPLASKQTSNILHLNPLPPCMVRVGAQVFRGLLKEPVRSGNDINNKNKTTSRSKKKEKMVTPPSVSPMIPLRAYWSSTRKRVWL